MKERIIKLTHKLRDSRFKPLRWVYSYFWGFHHIPRAIYFNSLSNALYAKYYIGTETRTDKEIILAAVMQGKRQLFWRPFKYPLFYFGVLYFKLKLLREPLREVYRICKEEYPRIYIPIYVICLIFLSIDYLRGNREP